MGVYTFFKIVCCSQKISYSYSTDEKRKAFDYVGHLKCNIYI